MTVRDLDLLMGYKYVLLAQASQQGELWERRQYFWQDIVEGKWGKGSLEYEMCEKESVLMTVSVNSKEVIGIEYLFSSLLEQALDGLALKSHQQPDHRTLASQGRNNGDQSPAIL